MAAPVARASPDLWHLSGATVTTAHRRASARGHGVRRDQCVVRASGDASDSRGTLAGAGSTSLAGVASERRAAVQAQVRLITAAKRFAAELAEGEEDEEQLVAVAAFDSSKEALTEVQKRYAGKIAETLAQARLGDTTEGGCSVCLGCCRTELTPRAFLSACPLQKVEELQVRNRAGSDAFVAGQKLYERGRYTDAVAALEQGVEDAGFDSQLGGEVRAPNNTILLYHRDAVPTSHTLVFTLFIRAPRLPCGWHSPTTQLDSGRTASACTSG